MVNVGFICEGESDALLFQSSLCDLFLKQLNINRVNVINANGCGNLLPHNITGYIESLEKQGAEKIIIITDLDDAPCLTFRKNQLGARHQDTVIIASKEIESWFLADSLCMKRLLRLQHFNFQQPETVSEPFDQINNLLVLNTGRGIGKSESGKIKLVAKIIEFGYDFHRSAAHGNCPSAAYWIKKLTEIGNGI